MADSVAAVHHDLVSKGDGNQPSRHCKTSTSGVLQSGDVSAAFVWLSSDDARFVTGTALPVAVGATAV